MPEASDKQREWAGWLTAALVMALGVWLRLPSMIHHDVAWSLYLTREYLAGARLYVDLIEINPPLIYWLMSPAVILANITGLSLSAAFKAYVFALGCLCMATSAPLLARMQSHRLRVVLPAVLAFTIAVLPRENFGQREHLLIILSMPWFLLAAARLEQTRISAAGALIIAAMAGLGFYLKPHFLLAPALVEALLVARLGWRAMWRPEQVVLALLGAVYAGLVMWFTPDYLSRVVRYGMEVYQTGYGRTYLATVMRQNLTLLLAVAAAFWWLTHRPVRTQAATAVMAAAAAGLLGAYVAQSKGWAYHAYPMQAVLIVCIGVMLAGMMQAATRNIAQKAATWFLLALLAANSITPLQAPHYQNGYVAAWSEEVAKRPQARSVLVMSANVYQGFPLVTQTGLTWASRFPCLWLTPGLKVRQGVEGNDNPMLAEIERYNRQAMFEDLDKHKPDLVFVDANEFKDHFGNVQYDYIEDFSHHDGFRRLWADYEKVGNRLGYDIYERRNTVGTLHLKPSLH